MNSAFAYHKIVLDDAGKPIDYIFLDANEDFVKLTGLKKEEILGKKVTEVLPGIENDPADWIGVYGKVAIDRKPVRFENYSQNLKKWYSVSAYSPEKGYFAVAFDDITDRKQAEFALLESEQRWATTLGSIGDAVIATDVAGKITFMNNVAEKLTGWHLPDASQKPLTEVFRIINEFTRGQVEDPVAKVLEKGLVVGLANHSLLVRKDGTEVAIDDSGAPIKDENGKTLGVVLVFRDITERKKEEEQIESLARFPSENPEPVLRITKDGIVAYSNAAGLRVLNELKSNVGQPAPSNWVQSASDALSSGGRVETEENIGEEIFAFVFAPVVDYINVYGRGITKRKRTEEALRQKQRDLNRAQAVAHMGSWRLDVRRNELLWSDETYRMFGVPAGTPLTYEAFLSMVHPDDREYVDKKWQAALRGERYKQSRVDSLLWAYRDVGYLYAHLNPLAPAEGEQKNYYTEPAHTYEQLTLAEFGLSDADLETEFWAGSVLSASKMKLSEIIRALRETYCSTVAVEFLHIQNKPIRRWLIQEMESTRNRPRFDADKKKVILEDLVTAEEFEHFMHTAFIGQKRFSLEGAEVVIPALHHVVDTARRMGIREIIMGMTHRGRLTVLNRILNKPLAEVFREFEGHEDPGDYGGSGDVRYHLGYETEHAHPDGSSVKVNLVANPSHLESVDPVVEGMARAVQRERGDTERKEVVPIVLHGDAAFSGQGVVAETFNLSTLRGYKTGGTIHVIINNQIGFTTSSRDARSTFFPTDVAKMLPVPVFHVNGDDAEAVVYTMDLALRFRQTFGRDVVVDIFCYRKYGHNEGDDPSFTHPLMYRIIEKKKSQPAIYAERCLAEGVAVAEESERTRKEFRVSLKTALQEARGADTDASVLSRDPNAWEWGERVAPAPEDRLRLIAGKLTAIPPGFHVHPKLKRIIDEKAARLEKDGTVDWAFAESLAFGTLLLEGIPVRLSGQDSARGTFSQRHLVWWDTETLVPQPYTPLPDLPPTRASSPCTTARFPSTPSSGSSTGIHSDSRAPW